jgi:hypothetical protein
MHKILMSSEQFTEICDTFSDGYVFKEEVLKWCWEAGHDFTIDLRLSDDVKIFIEFYLMSEDEDALLEFKLRWL